MESSELWGGAAQPTAQMVMAEGYEGNGVFSNNESSVKLVVESETSGHCLDDRP